MEAPLMSVLGPVETSRAGAGRECRLEHDASGAHAVATAAPPRARVRRARWAQSATDVVCPALWRRHARRPGTREGVSSAYEGLERPRRCDRRVAACASRATPRCAPRAGGV